MSYSTQRSVSDGTLQLLMLEIEFFDKSEITAYLDNLPTTDFVWATDSSIRFNAPVPAGVEVLLRRTTDLSSPRHVFTDGAQFKAATLDEDFKQILHIAQEAKEGLDLTDVFNNLDMHQFRVRNLAPGILSTDAVTLGQAESIIAASPSMQRSVRVPDTDSPIGPMPTAALRASKVLGFDATGSPVAVAPASGSSTELAMDLYNRTDPSKGAGMVGYNGGSVASALAAAVSAANLANQITPEWGASLVGYRGRTLKQKLDERTSVRDAPYSVDNTGVVSASSGIQAAIDEKFAAGGGIVWLPAGVYLITVGLILRLGVTLLGESEFFTTLVPGTAGMTVVEQSYTSNSGAMSRVANVNINCGSVPGVRGQYYKYCNRVVVENVIWYGCAVNVEYDMGGFLTLINCVAAGTETLKTGQLKLWSSRDDTYGAVFSVIHNYRIENNGAGIQSPAIYQRRAVGLKYSCIPTTNNPAGGTGIGILFENDCQGILVSGALFVGFTIGAVFQQGTGIAKAPIFNMLQDVDFDQCSVASVLHSQGSNNSIRGGVITSSDVGTNTKAISVTAGSKNFKISQTKVSGYYGVDGGGIILADTVGSNISDVEVDGCQQGITFVGTQTRLDIHDVDLSSGVVQPIVNSYAGATNSVRNVKGYSAAGVVATPAMPASTAVVTNTSGALVRVFINSGTVTLIAINGSPSGFTTGAMLLLWPGETISITYTEAPSWNWIGV